MKGFCRLLENIHTMHSRIFLSILDDIKNVFKRKTSSFSVDRRLSTCFLYIGYFIGLFCVQKIFSRSSSDMYIYKKINKFVSISRRPFLGLSEIEVFSELFCKLLLYLIFLKKFSTNKVPSKVQSRKIFQ